MDNVAQKLMDIARWYSMPADHFNTIKKAVELLNRPRCSLKKCPFLDGAHGRTAHGGGRMSDLIERQAILDGLEKYHENTDLQYIDGLTYAYDLVCKLPSVSTEKTGQWIDVEGYEGLLCKCSNCCKDGERYKHRTHQSKTNFCPDCGARMNEPQESEVKDADSD